jgi:hypothetical protein
MPPRRKSPSLFEPVLPTAKLHPSYQTILAAPASAPARAMIDTIFGEMPDPDGHFVREFQTNGFDARLFELYLYAYFSRSGYAVDRSHHRPDFLIERGGLQVCVEATTANASPNDLGRKTPLDELSSSERRQYSQQELPIRLGAPSSTS